MRTVSIICTLHPLFIEHIDDKLSIIQNLMIVFSTSATRNIHNRNSKIQEYIITFIGTGVRPDDGVESVKNQRFSYTVKMRHEFSIFSGRKEDDPKKNRSFTIH